MTIRNQYQVSTTGAERIWTVPQARLTNNAPTETQPAALLSLLSGTQLTGTIVGVDAGDDMATIDVTPGKIFAHNVRNVRTYNAGAENTFGVINIGDPIYYDRSSTMPADYFLSTSPLDKDGAANPLFGFAVPADDEDTYPKGAAGATSVADVPVMQVGAGR